MLSNYAEEIVCISLLEIIVQLSSLCPYSVIKCNIQVYTNLCLLHEMCHWPQGCQLLDSTLFFFSSISSPSILKVHQGSNSFRLVT